jgi:hypothetical protein
MALGGSLAACDDGSADRRPPPVTTTTQVAVTTTVPVGSTSTTSTLLAPTTTRPTSSSTTIVTTTTSTTTSLLHGSTTSTTTTSLPGECVDSISYSVVFFVSNTETLGSLQFDVDYDGVAGSFLGRGAGVECVRLAGDFAAFNDKDASKILSVAVIAATSFTGPIDVVRCEFGCPLTLSPGDFAITIVDQARPDFSPAAAQMGVRIESPLVEARVRMGSESD